MIGRRTRWTWWSPPRLALLAGLTLGAGLGGSPLPLGGGAAQASERTDRIAQARSFTVTIEGDGVYGAGVLVDPAQGAVMTNLHVVKEMRAPRVTFHDGASFQGRVERIDGVLDLALVKIPPQPARGRPAWGDASSLRAGDDVFAVGCPRHLCFTVSRGIVSFVDRMMEGVRYLQTDLPINEGNSGGPVINERGELVGFMSFVYRGAQGLSFALPASYAKAWLSAPLPARARSTAADRSGPGTPTSRPPAPGPSADRSRRWSAGRSSPGT